MNDYKPHPRCTVSGRCQAMPLMRETADKVREPEPSLPVLIARGFFGLAVVAVSILATVCCAWSVIYVATGIGEML